MKQCAGLPYEEGITEEKDCINEIPYGSVRCEECRPYWTKIKKREYNRLYDRGRMLMVKVRFCEDCDDDITHRHGLAKYCENCSEVREFTCVKKNTQSVRACLKCKKDFRSDGPENRLCSICRLANSEIKEGLPVLRYSGPGNYDQ